MFSRAAVQASPQWTQVRHMATLKAIAMRLRAVTNIQKITKSMKMVSAAKYAKAERELKSARAYGLGAQSFFEKAEVQSPEKPSNFLLVATTSDRGLCGSAHSNISRAIRAAIPELPPGSDYKIVCIGDKSRAILSRMFAANMLMTFNNIGRRPPTFSDASYIAQEIMSCGYEFDKADVYYNIFKSVVSFRTTTLPFFTLDQVMNAGKISMYDSLDDEVTRSYNEYALANLVYYALKESACSEQSARMTAMDAASKNAGEMIDKLSLLYNRTRQAVITRELIEIISGAAAL